MEYVPGDTAVMEVFAELCDSGGGRSLRTARGRAMTGEAHTILPQASPMIAKQKGMSTSTPTYPHRSPTPPSLQPTQVL